MVLEPLSVEKKKGLQCLIGSTDFSSAVSYLPFSRAHLCVFFFCCLDIVCEYAITHARAFVLFVTKQPSTERESSDKPSSLFLPSCGLNLLLPSESTDMGNTCSGKAQDPQQLVRSVKAAPASTASVAGAATSSSRRFSSVANSLMSSAFSMCEREESGSRRRTVACPPLATSTNNTTADSRLFSPSSPLQPLPTSRDLFDVQEGGRSKLANLSSAGDANTSNSICGTGNNTTTAPTTKLSATITTTASTTLLNAVFDCRNSDVQSQEAPRNPIQPFDERQPPPPPPLARKPSSQQILQPQQASRRLLRFTSSSSLASSATSTTATNNNNNTTTDDLTTIEDDEVFAGVGNHDVLLPAASHHRSHASLDASLSAPTISRINAGRVSATPTTAVTPADSRSSTPSTSSTVSEHDCPSILVRQSSVGVDNATHANAATSARRFSISRNSSARAAMLMFKKEASQQNLVSTATSAFQPPYLNRTDSAASRSTASTDMNDDEDTLHKLQALNVGRRVSVCLSVSELHASAVETTRSGERVPRRADHVLLSVPTPAGGVMNKLPAIQPTVSLRQPMHSLPPLPNLLSSPRTTAQGMKPPQPIAFSSSSCSPLQLHVSPRPPYAASSESAITLGTAGQVASGSQQQQLLSSPAPSTAQAVPAVRTVSSASSSRRASLLVVPTTMMTSGASGSHGIGSKRLPPTGALLALRSETVRGATGSNLQPLTMHGGATLLST